MAIERHTVCLRVETTLVLRRQRDHLVRRRSEREGRRAHEVRERPGWETHAARLLISPRSASFPNPSREMRGVVQNASTQVKVRSQPLTRGVY